MRQLHVTAVTALWNTAPMWLASSDCPGKMRWSPGLSYRYPGRAPLTYLSTTLVPCTGACEKQSLESMQTSSLPPHRTQSPPPPVPPFLPPSCTCYALTGSSCVNFSRVETASPPVAADTKAVPTPNSSRAFVHLLSRVSLCVQLFIQTVCSSRCLVITSSMVF